MKTHELNEEEYKAAIRGCGRYALQRLFKKMTKRKYGKAEYQAVYHMWLSPLTGETRMAINKAAPHGLVRQYRSPLDLETYIANFVAVHKDKPAVREYKED